ncbi:hypothetical protein PGH45_18525 [Legionella pneumophila]|nr:hypothetical protein [Legionella pneumophila]
MDDKQGKESTVNTRREGKYIVVQRLAPQFTLRQGCLSASVLIHQKSIASEQTGGQNEC